MSDVRRRHWVAVLVSVPLLAAPSLARPLEVHPANPRWLTNDGGDTAMVLTGAHAWGLVQDYEFSPVFDAVDYLDSLRDRGHNFTRGWYWEDAYYSPLPYVEQGGRYRLSPPYNTAYFKRLRKRIRAAGRRGIYVSVMLFQGWSMDDRGGLRQPGPWPVNPYNRTNTTERVTKQQAALHIGQAQQQQLEYVSHLGRRLCSEPNIVWEIVNEAHPDSLGTAKAINWQRAILEQLQAACGRHLTWVSCPWQSGMSPEERRAVNETMAGMGSDLVAPCDPGRFSSRPPATDGRKVLVADSDHFDLREIGSDWVWKTFLRGSHPLFVDLEQTLTWWSGPPWDPDDRRWTEIHRALGAVQELVATVNRIGKGQPATGLAEMAPQSSAGGGPRDRFRPASSAWTLFSSDRPCPKRTARGGCGQARANGDEFLVYAGPSESIRICSLEAGAAYRLRWKKAARRGFVGPASFDSADPRGCLELDNPADTTAVVHLQRQLAAHGS